VARKSDNTLPLNTPASLKDAFELTSIEPKKAPETTENVLGNRLRALRVEKKLTIRALSELSGLAINTLSMVENGKTSPSVSTLQQLARALGVPITAFFEAESLEKQVVYVRKNERPKADFKTTRLEHLGMDLARNVIQPFVVTLEAGAGSGTRLIVHTGHEFVYCLSGKVLYTIDEQSYLLESGDSIIFESHLPHRWQNVDAQPSKIILVLCPADTLDTPAEKHFPIK